MKKTGGLDNSIEKGLASKGGIFIKGEQNLGGNCGLFNFYIFVLKLLVATSIYHIKKL